MARGQGRSPVLDPQEIGTFDTLVKEEQSLKERMQARLTEIMPAVEEAENIKQWLSDHTESNGSAPTAAAPAAPAQTSTRSQGQRRQGNNGQGNKRGQRREQFLNVVREHPEGITVADVAKELGAAPAYFYRLAGILKEQGMVADAPNGNGVVAA